MEEYPAKITTKEFERLIHTHEFLGIPLKSHSVNVPLLSSPLPIQIPHMIYKLSAEHVHPAKVKLQAASLLSHSLGLPTHTGIWLRWQNSRRLLFSRSKYTLQILVQIPYQTVLVDR